MVAVLVTSAPRQQGLEIKMKNTGSKLLKVGFNKDIDALRLASIIEKRGGYLHNGSVRFPDSSHEEVSMKTKYQAYDVTFAINDKAIELTFNEEDAEKITDEDLQLYKTLFINSLKNGN